MASIKISDLQPAGSDFFNDSESFMNELTDKEIVNTQGGAESVSLMIIGASAVIVTTVIGIVESVR